jgi:hypothetical protein
VRIAVYSGFYVVVTCLGPGGTLQVIAQDADVGTEVLTAPLMPDPIMYADFVTVVNGTEVVHPSLSVQLVRSSWLYPEHTQVREAWPRSSMLNMLWERSGVMFNPAYALVLPRPTAWLTRW